MLNDIPITTNCYYFLSHTTTVAHGFQQVKSKGVHCNINGISPESDSPSVESLREPELSGGPLAGLGGDRTENGLIEILDSIAETGLLSIEMTLMHVLFPTAKKECLYSNL